MEQWNFRCVDSARPDRCGAVKEIVARFVTECAVLEDVREQFGVARALGGCAGGNIAVQREGGESIGLLEDFLKKKKLIDKCSQFQVGKSTHIRRVNHSVAIMENWNQDHSDRNSILYGLYGKIQGCGRYGKLEAGSP